MQLRSTPPAALPLSTARPLPPLVPASAISRAPSTSGIRAAFYYAMLGPRVAATIFQLQEFAMKFSNGLWCATVAAALMAAGCNSTSSPFSTHYKSAALQPAINLDGPKQVSVGEQ